MKLTITAAKMSIFLALAGRVAPFAPSTTRNLISPLTQRITTSFSSSSSTLITPRFMSATADAPPKEETVTLPTNESDEDLLKIRHSSAHVMAMAVQQVFPEAQVTIGPWIDNGFYYDFFFPETIDDLRCCK